MDLAIGASRRQPTSGRQRTAARGAAGDFAGRVRAHLAAARLLEPGARVLVAVSGGLDSVVLLHLLRFAAPPGGFRLVAAHFDHAMRPGSSGDAAWVAGLCRAWSVPLRTARASPAPRSETEARQARYRFLAESADAAEAGHVATAHHADDQAETVLFRAVRGTGLAGLAGIPPRRGRFVRPLLPFRRAELEAYAAAAGLRFRQDPTNLELGYARNRLRHEVLPRLESIAPGAAAALVRLADHARRAEEAWDWVLDRLAGDAVLDRDPDGVTLARSRFLSYHPAVRARLLRRLLRPLGSAPDRAGTMAALEFINFGASGGQMQVARGVRLEREFDRIRIRLAPPAHGTPPDRGAVIPAPGEGTGQAVLAGRRFTVRWTAASHELAGAAEVFDPSALRFPLWLRAWQPGDRIRLPFGTKKLKKLFGERRVGRAARSRTPVLVDAAGRVLWVVGLARAEFARPGPVGATLAIAVQDAGPAYSGPSRAHGRPKTEAHRVHRRRDRDPGSRNGS